MAQNETGCTIHIIDDDDDECVDRNDVCPNLRCAAFRTNADGCEICECADDPPPPPPGGECSSDADCGRGEYCELIETCPACRPAPGGNTCDAPCLLEGHCVPAASCDDGTELICDRAAIPECGPGEILAVQNNCFVCVDQRTCQPPGKSCFADFDCAEGEQCVSPCDDASGRPNDSDRPISCEGTCQPILTCANVLCAPGQRCVEENGQAKCVGEASECEVDDDCGPNAHCEVICGVDPNCPQCDVCFFQGVCVEDPREPECRSDDECGAGKRCNAAEVCLPNPSCNANGECTRECWGFCEAASCQTDSDCGEGGVCILEDNCGGCNDANGCFVPCRLEGHCG